MPYAIIDGGKTETGRILELLEKEKNERRRWDSINIAIAIISILIALAGLIITVTK